MVFFITTPLYYVNAEPHIGHAYTTVLADVLARYHRMGGERTFFLTGTDEHGQKLADTAKMKGLPPLGFCNQMVERFKDLWEILDIEYDDFIRTTEERHERVVKAVLVNLYERGEIYKGSYDGWYCVPDERFWTEKDLVDGRCPDCGREVIRLSETNYFFRMSAYQGWLVEYIESHPDFIQPPSRRNEILGFLKKPLEDLCISRPKSRLSWGIELPFDAEYVSYVWFDALLNYISAPGYLFDQERFEKLWPARHQLIGKDILTTHAVYWPIMLRAIGLEPPETIIAHGWWLLGEDKMSKSRGNVVSPEELTKSYGADPFRYFLIREMTLGQDANFGQEALVGRLNSDLANDLGNLESRLLKMVDSWWKGKIPQPGDYLEEDEALKSLAPQVAERVEELVRKLKLDEAIEETFGLVKATNRYLETTSPWKLEKEGRRERLGTVLYTACEALRVVSLLLSPVMPGSCSKIRERLSIGEVRPSWDDARRWGLLLPGGRVRRGKPLFPRLKLEEPAEELVSWEEFKRLRLRTAKVKEAESIEGSDRLLRLKIDLGGELRQIVAGIAHRYSPQELIGKEIVVVANLQPTKIKGVESRGMLLAAVSGEDLVLIRPDGEIPPGARVE
jgi:methionyl-tRNA synthetase